MKIFDSIRKSFVDTAFERFLAKRTQNHKVGSFWTRLVPQNTSYAHNSFRVIKREGITVKVDLSDYVGHYYYFNFRDDNINRLFSLVKPGASVIDIGANIGYVSLTFARLAGPTGKVYSFEPDPYNYQLCQSNLKLNQFSNISLFQKGIGDVAGQFKLAIETDSNRGGNRIVEDSTSKEYSIIDVVKLDDVLSDISAIDLIKIDIEGFELNALRGAEQLLKKFHPIVFTEIDSQNLKNQKTSISELVKYMKSVGYTAVIDAETGQAVNESSMEDYHHTDFIFYYDK